MTEASDIKPRRPLLAALLTFIATGLGQFYNGQWQKGVLFFLVELAVGAVAIFGLASFSTMALGLAALFAVNISVATEAFLSARKLTEYRLQPCNKAVVYAMLILTNGFVATGMELVTADNLHKTFEVKSESMLPTLLFEEHIMADMLTESDGIARGDVVVFQSPDDATENLVLRVVGLPGETVLLAGDAVTIDGQALDEPYAQLSEEAKTQSDAPVTLGAGEYFVMGDNRGKPEGSTAFGPVSREAILGKALYVYFPGEMPGLGWFKRFGMEIQ